MNSMNEAVKMTSKIKEKAVEVIADVLIHQGEHGVKYSLFAFSSESSVPVNLMNEDTE